MIMAHRRGARRWRHAIRTSHRAAARARAALSARAVPAPTSSSFCPRRRVLHRPMICAAARSGASALTALPTVSKALCPLISVAVEAVVAFFGYNLVHAVERSAFPILTVIFLIAAGVILSKAHPGAVHHTIPGAFLLTFGASFGYAVGWNPYASDYTRYFKPDTSRTAIAWWSGTGLFLSCALLEIVGAAVGTAVGAGNALAGPGGVTSLLATPLADLTLPAIALGAVSANVLNIYSGALSVTAIGIKLPLALRRAVVGLGVGAIGFFLAWSGLHAPGT